jgi:hypothetical protein
MFGAFTAAELEHPKGLWGFASSLDAEAIADQKKSAN